MTNPEQSVCRCAQQGWAGDCICILPGDHIGGHPDQVMRRAERAVVSGLAREYGKGQQAQVTLPDRIEIAAGGVVVTIRREEQGDARS